MGADRPSEGHLFGDGHRITVGFGAVPFLTGLLAHLVEVGITQATEKTGSSCLGNIGHLGHPRGGKCQKVVLVVKHQPRQLLLRRRQPVETFLDTQCQPGRHMDFNTTSHSEKNLMTNLSNHATFVSTS